MAVTKIPHLLFKKTWVDFLRDEFSINPEVAMNVFFAICDYAYKGEIPNDVTLRLAIGAIRKEIDDDRAAYEELSGKRRQVRIDAIAKKQNQQNEQTEQLLTNRTNATSGTIVDNIIYNNIQDNNIQDNNSSSKDSELDKTKKNRKKKVERELTEEEISFIEFEKSSYPRISRMDEPLTLGEYNTLLSKYGRQVVQKCMQNLNNYKKINNYVSAKDTLENWCKLEIERYGNNNTGSKQKPDLISSILNGAGQA